MASDLILSQISHYQKKLEKYASVGEDEKLLYCIHKLKYLPVTVNHLEVTGVGKSINSLRHRHGTIGEKSRALVQKWKLMVAAEEHEEQHAHEKEEPLDQNISYTKDTKIKTASSTAPVSSTPADCDNLDEEEYDASDEGDRLQIEENDPVDKTYNPGGTQIPDNEEDNCNGYNPLTSREDYLSVGVDVPANPYYPSTGNDSPSNSYVPVAKNDDHEEETSKDSAPSASRSMINGNDHSHKEKIRSHEDDDQHRKRKHHKSKHKHVEKHHNAISSTSGSNNKEKSKDKSPSRKKHSKEKHRHKDSHKQKHKEHSENDKKETSSRHENEKQSSQSSHKSSSLTTTNNNNNNSSTSSSSSHSTPIASSPSKLKRNPKSVEEDAVDKTGKYSPLYEKMIESNNNKFKESFAQKPKKKIKDEQKSKKRKPEETPESSSGFGAALMGMDSLTKKKKKKKSRDKEGDLIEPEDEIDINFSDKPKYLDANYGKSLPELPSSFDDGDEHVATQLMTHYKPLPSVPQRAASKDPFTLQMTNEEALNYMLSSKSNKQRKIYAGKATRLTDVPSLFDLCIRVLQENIDALEATGGIPFDLLRPVLERATPQQLFTLEDYNPYLLEDTDTLWNSHCRKAFKNKERDDMETWREMFIRCTDEHHEKMRSVTENLQKKYVTKAVPKRTTQLAFINTAAKPPRGVARAQAKYGTASTSSSHHRPTKAQEDASSPPKSGVVVASGAAVPKPNRPFAQQRPTAVKKPKLAPLMAKSRLLHKKVCRR